MDSAQVKEHWHSWATTRTGVCQTSMCPTIKELEIAALARRIASLPSDLMILEAGCGNGQNCIELAKRFPQSRFYGFDYIPEMIDAAKKNSFGLRVWFTVADLLDLHSFIKIDQTYDVVISDRLIINLKTVELQREGKI